MIMQRLIPTTFRSNPSHFCAVRGPLSDLSATTTRNWFGLIFPTLVLGVWKRSLKPMYAPQRSTHSSTRPKKDACAVALFRHARLGPRPLQRQHTLPTGSCLREVLEPIKSSAAAFRCGSWGIRPEAAAYRPTIGPSAKRTSTGSAPLRPGRFATCAGRLPPNSRPFLTDCGPSRQSYSLDRSGGRFGQRGSRGVRAGGERVAARALHLGPGNYAHSRACSKIGYLM
jgi:hypothetical protein